MLERLLLRLTNTNSAHEFPTTPARALPHVGASSLSLARKRQAKRAAWSPAPRLSRALPQQPRRPSALGPRLRHGAPRRARFSSRRKRARTRGLHGSACHVPSRALNPLTFAYARTLRALMFCDDVQGVVGASESPPQRLEDAHIFLTGPTLAEMSPAVPDGRRAPGRHSRGWRVARGRTARTAHRRRTKVREPPRASRGRRHMVAASMFSEV